MAERGRPTDYDPKFCAIAKKMCELGATDRELADALEINVSTLNRWKLAHPDFCASVIMGKDVCDERVERSLYNRAVGYSFDATKIFMPSGADEPVYAPYVEHVAPDPGAAMNWLKNRRGGVWRDRQDHVHDVSDDLKDVLRKARERVV